MMLLVNSSYLTAEATRSANWRWTGTGAKSYQQEDPYRALRHGALVGPTAMESGLPEHAGAGHRGSIAVSPGAGGLVQGTQLAGKGCHPSRLRSRNRLEASTASADITIGNPQLSSVSAWLTESH